MNQHAPDQAWQVERPLTRLITPWLNLIGERLKTSDGAELDYWRIERADSAIVVPIWRQHLLLPAPIYRPGIQEVTLDFPGGRVQPGQSSLDAAKLILQRELTITAEAIQSIHALNLVGWPVNSSLSNQRLYGFWAQLRDDTDLAPGVVGQQYSFTPSGIAQLLAVLPCLQCRALLMELQLQLRR